MGLPINELNVENRSRITALPPLKPSSKSKILRESNSYMELVQRAQNALDLIESEHTLRINLRNKTISVANLSVELTERESFVYALLAILRIYNRGENGFVSFDEITSSDLDLTFRRITSSRGDEFALEDCEFVPRFDFLQVLSKQISSNHPIDREDVKVTFIQTFSRIKRKFEDAKLPSHYSIVTRGRPKSPRYGLEVEPERIVLV
jgi:hypothetical protein